MMMMIIIYTDITLLATSVSVGRSWHGMLAMRPKTHASARRRRRHRVTSTDRLTDGPPPPISRSPSASIFFQLYAGVRA